MMNKLPFLFLKLVILLPIISHSQESLKPPNILLIMCDDLGWGDVGFNGNKEVKTPNLDQLAAKGIILTRFYSASPVCSPTRASCLTGRNPSRQGIFGANQGHLRASEITLPELLKTKNYKTGHFGKWHLGTLTTKIKDANRGMPGDSTHYSIPTQHGYDQYFCTESKVPTWDPMVKPNTFNEVKGESLRYGWAAIIDGDKREKQDYGTYYWVGEEKRAEKNLEGDNSRIIMDRVIPFVESSVASDQPFFATVWLHTPHLPLVTSEKYRNLYSELDYQKQLLYGSITATDDQIGRLWQKLKALNIDENTIIWFCSDNGPERQTPGSVGPYRERKRSLYEGGVRVPAFCLWPNRLKGGQSIDIPMVTSDYLPTIIDWLNITYPDPDRPLDGISLTKALAGKQTFRNSPIGFQYLEGGISWVTDRHKLIRSNVNSPFELYDLRSDPVEAKDLAKRHTLLVRALEDGLIDWILSCKESEETGK